MDALILSWFGFFFCYLIEQYMLNVQNLSIFFFSKYRYTINFVFRDA